MAELWDRDRAVFPWAGDGKLAGIDNGDLSDVTPFSSEIRKTYRGDLAVYVRRIGAEDISVFLTLSPDNGTRETITLTLEGKKHDV